MGKVVIIAALTFAALAYVGSVQSATALTAMLLAIIALHQWWRFGFGRGVVCVLYWLAAQLAAMAHATDRARIVYHEKMAGRERPTSEPVVRAVYSGDAP